MKKSAVAVVFAVLALLGAAALAQNRQVAASQRSEWIRFNPVTPLTAASFAQPPAADLPWVRMNMPAPADPAEIAVEVQQMHDNGIGGVEIGQGAFPNNEQLVALLKAANQVGIKVSLSHGPTQNPPGYSIDDDHARKTLVVGKAVVNAGESFEGRLPPPTLTAGGRSGFGGLPTGGRGRGPGGRGRGTVGSPAGGGAVGRGRAGGRGTTPQPNRATLIAVLAYRCTTTPCPVAGPAELDRSSMIDLTASVTGKNTEGVLGGTSAGNIGWTAPSSPPSAQWQLIAFWSRGVFAQPDPFSEEGYSQLVNSMETGLSAEVKELMRANGGDLFYDSHSSDRGSPDELWTNKMAEEFRSRRQYSLIPNLPALFQDLFSFSDGSAPRVRNDLYAVRGDIWLEKQIAPLRTWARKYNNVLRVQVEGEASMTTPITDMVLATAAVDRPEHENLFVGDEVDNYLPMASANHMTGNPWYSTECCAAFGQAYAETFQDAVIRMHRSFVGGITKLVYHVYPYRDSATSKWPGYHNFGQAGFSNAWGPRNPFWVDARAYNNYLARNQQVLTQGDAKTDVAVYMQNYLYPPSQGFKYRAWGDPKLWEAGYTRDYLNPTMLELPNATVSGARLAANGPAYKALIIDAEQGPPTDPVKTSMPVEVARKILDYARAGLPVVVVGTPPDRTPGNTPDADPVLRGIIADLLRERSVSQVAHESDVPGKLRSLGIRPSAEPANPSAVLSIRRRDAATRTDYYFFYNQGIVSPPDEPRTLFEPATGEPVDLKFSLEGRGQPYILDAWAGTITPILNYSSSGDRVTMRIRLSRDNGILIALSEQTNRFGIALPEVHVTETSADDVGMNQGAIVIRASAAGTYNATLSNGRSIRGTIGAVPPTIDLTHVKWHLSAEDWQPDNPYATTFGAEAAQTRKDRVELDLDGLKPWPEIAALKDASGLGTYTTTFNLPATWTSANGATLSLGEVFDTFTVSVNGRTILMDQLSAEGDVGSYLRAGPNTIVVRVATTLNNRLARIDEDVANRGLVQPYGLVGPVRLTPYGTATVWSNTRR
jgi:alpha-L-rhamnosidase